MAESDYIILVQFHISNNCILLNICCGYLGPVTLCLHGYLQMDLGRPKQQKHSKCKLSLGCLSKILFTCNSLQMTLCNLVITSIVQQPPLSCVQTNF